MSRSEPVVMARTSVPLMLTRPSSTSQKRMSRRQSVDLPDPERPWMATIWPGSTSMLTSSRIFSGAASRASASPPSAVAPVP